MTDKHGNNYQLRAEKIQEMSYRLSGDDVVMHLIKSPVIETSTGITTIWDCLVSKYMENENKRGILGALGKMAGMEV